MKICTKSHNSKQILLAIPIFILLFLSFSGNVFRIADSHLFAFFDMEDEGLVIGRIEKGFRDGIFADGGFPGSYITSDSLSINANRSIQRYNFINDIPNEGQFNVYKSQSGGQGILYSFLYKFLPFSNHTCLYLFKILNAALIAFVFVLFICWIYRNYSLTSAIIFSILLIISPKVIYFSHNLWWALWSFYIPFLIILLLLEKKKKQNSVKLLDNRILFFLFLSMFLKCIFTGFEFITTTLIAALCPILYYELHRTTINYTQTILSLFKAGVCMTLAIVAEMLVMIGQFKLLTGSFMDGINHIIYSFNKSSLATETTVEISLKDILFSYLNTDNMLYLYNSAINIKTYILLIMIILACIVIYILNKKIRDKDMQKTNFSLIVTVFFSTLAPLSWYVIFQEHSYVHTFFDFIVLYMPLFLYGFLAIGHSLHLLYDIYYYKKKINN